MEQEVQPKSIPTTPQKEEPPVDRKVELLAKKAKNHNHLSPAEQRELDEILAKEAREHRRGALIHRLRDAAIRRGRKKADKIRREVTDEAAEINKQRTERNSADEARFLSKKKEYEKGFKTRVQELQEELNANISTITALRDTAILETNKHYRALLDVKEQELDRKIAEIGSVCDDFSAILEVLDLDQLEELEKTGRVEVAGGGGEAVVVVPGS